MSPLYTITSDHVPLNSQYLIPGRGVNLARPFLSLRFDNYLRPDRLSVIKNGPLLDPVKT